MKDVMGCEIDFAIIDDTYTHDLVHVSETRNSICISTDGIYASIENPKHDFKSTEESKND